MPFYCLFKIKYQPCLLKHKLIYLTNDHSSVDKVELVGKAIFKLVPQI